MGTSQRDGHAGGAGRLLETPTPIAPLSIEINEINPHSPRAAGSEIDPPKELKSRGPSRVSGAAAARCPLPLRIAAAAAMSPTIFCRDPLRPSLCPMIRRILTSACLPCSHGPGNLHYQRKLPGRLRPQVPGAHAHGRCLHRRHHRRCSWWHVPRLHPPGWPGGESPHFRHECNKFSHIRTLPFFSRPPSTRTGHRPPRPTSPTRRSTRSSVPPPRPNSLGDYS